LTESGGAIKKNNDTQERGPIHSKTGTREEAGPLPTDWGREDPRRKKTTKGKERVSLQLQIVRGDKIR